MTRHGRPLIASLTLLAACANPTAGLPPPGTPGGEPARFFYPIAVALDPCGDHLYVANSNFDRAFNEGTLVSISTSLFDTGESNPPFPTDPSQYTAGLLDTFASNMLVASDAVGEPCPNPAEPPTGRLYVTTRNNITLSHAFVDSNGSFQCPVDANGLQDCSSDAVLLGPMTHFVDPFALKLAQTTLPGGAAPQSVVLVSHLSQYPTSSNGVGEDTHVAVIPEPLQNEPPVAGAPVEPFSQFSFAVDIGQPGSNALVVGPDNAIYVGGCFLLISGGTDATCLNNTNNLTYYHLDPIRSFFLNAGPQTTVSTSGVGPLLGTSTTGGGSMTDMALSTGGTSLYVATETPDALLVTGFPQSGTMAAPALQTIIPLAYTPQRILVLPRAGGDLIAVAVTESNAFVVVDPNLGQVVAQIEPIGNQPFGMTAMPTPTGFRVYVTLFNDCGVAAVDVTTTDPVQASVVSIIGQSCVQTSQQFVLFQGLL